MRTISEYLDRLRKVAMGSAVLTEGDIIREVQTDAYHEGYATAARDLFGIALESQERMDTLLTRAASAGIVHGDKAVAN